MDLVIICPSCGAGGTTHHDSEAGVLVCRNKVKGTDGEERICGARYRLEGKWPYTRTILVSGPKRIIEVVAAVPCMA